MQVYYSERFGMKTVVAIGVTTLFAQRHPSVTPCLAFAFESCCGGQHEIDARMYAALLERANDITWTFAKEAMKKDGWETEDNKNGLMMYVTCPCPGTADKPTE